MIKRSDMVIKIGLVRCEMASRSCPGTSCFKVIKTGTGTLEEFKDEEIDNWYGHMWKMSGKGFDKTGQGKDKERS